MNVAVGWRIFHANACIPYPRERKDRDTDYFRATVARRYVMAI